MEIIFVLLYAVGFITLVVMCISLPNHLKDKKFKNPDWVKRNAKNFFYISEDKKQIVIQSGFFGLYSDDSWVMKDDILYKTKHDREICFVGITTFDEIVIKQSVAVNAIQSISITRPQKSLTMGLNGWLRVEYIDYDGTDVDEMIFFKPIAWQASALIYYRFCEVHDIVPTLTNHDDYPWPYHEQFNPIGVKIISFED